MSNITICPSNINFYKLFNSNKWTLSKSNTNSGVDVTGNNILSFSRSKNNNTFFIGSSFSNLNFLYLNEGLNSDSYAIGSCVSMENLESSNFLINQVFYQNSWNMNNYCNHYKLSNSVSLNTIMCFPFLLILNLFLNTFQVFFNQMLRHESVGSLVYNTSNQINDTWLDGHSFNILRFAASEEIYQCSYNNLRLGSVAPCYSGSSALNGCSSIILPSYNILFVESDNTSGTLCALNLETNNNTVWQNSDLNSQASFFYDLGSNPSVSGNAMNPFDHPNGGFNHSSNILNTFNGNKILK